MLTGSVFSIAKIKELDGFLAARVTGKGVYKLFLPEAGGHRWQRIPPTEKRGRKHSSTVTVAVLLENINTSVDITSNDLRIETMRGQGPGGQKRNVTASAVRITHLPTGITAYSDIKSQAQNKKLALKTLKDRLTEISVRNYTTKINSARQKQVGTGMRADKIRTVAEQRGRVENHLNGKRLSLKKYLRGFIEDIQ